MIVSYPMKNIPASQTVVIKLSSCALALLLLPGCTWFHNHWPGHKKAAPPATAAAPATKPESTPPPAAKPDAPASPATNAAPAAPAATMAPAVPATDDEIRSVVSRVAKHLVKPLADGEYPAVTNIADAKTAKVPEGISWGYPWGVALYGMEESSSVTGDKDIDNFVVQHDQICGRYYHWQAGLISQFGDEGKTFTRSLKAIRPLMTLGNLDSCGAMGNQMVESMIRHPDQVTPEETEVVERIADYIANKQARLPDGTLWRPTSAGDDKTMKPGTVWPDDLYMGGVFLARWGIYKHDPKFIDDAGTNIINQAKLTQDSDGLWFHGYFINENQHAPYKWGRGNGWVTVTLVETISAMDDNDPLKAQLIDILRKQIDGLKKVQSADGMWHQVLDHPEVWEETSCTAMFAYGIARAVNKGWIDASNMDVARRAFDGIAKKVGPDGSIADTCHGTNIGGTLDFYINRPHDGDDPHGWGPVMLAGTEILAGKK